MTQFPMPFNNPHTYAGHGGIDYPQPAFTPIRAIGNGEITFSARWNARAGLTRTLTLDNGLQVMHCHLVNLAGPPVGSRVKAGEVIGYVGTTGFSTGNHLHHELWWRGVKQAGANYWKWIDRNRVIGAPQPKPSGGGSTPKPKPAIPTPSEEEDMPIIIVQKRDSQAAKGQMTHNRKMRLITKYENIAYRAAQNQSPDSVIYVTVSDSDFNNLLAGNA